MIKLLLFIALKKPLSIGLKIWDLQKNRRSKECAHRCRFPEKKTRADFLINNSSKISNLKPRIAVILKKLAVS